MRFRHLIVAAAAALIAALLAGSVPPAAASSGGLTGLTGRATASSSSDAAHSAALAVDGNPATGWAPRSSDADPYLQVDLRAAVWLQGVRQTFASRKVWKFTVSASTDGASWVTVADRSYGVEGQTFSLPASGLFRYVRISGAGISSQEFTVTGVQKGTNIALGAKVSASSTSDNHEAAAAVDGDTSTYWRATGSSTSPAQILTVDLGSPSVLTGIEQRFKDYDTWSLTLQASVDGSKWRTFLNDSTGARGIDYNVKASGTYRYVRVTVSGAAGKSWPTSAEFAVYGYGDIALGSATTADSQAGGWEASNAVDGDPATAWGVTDPGFPHNMTVDLGGPSALQSISQAFVDDDTWKFTLEGSLDDQNWTMLVDDNTPDGVHGRVFSNPVSGTYRYVKLTVYGSALGHWACSQSLNIIGSRFTRDLAPGVVATSSSTVHGHYPTAAADRDPATGWEASSAAMPQHLTLDLGDAAMISGVSQTFADNDTWKFTLRASVDGHQWTTLADHRSAGVAGRTFTAGADGTYRYIRLDVYGSANGHLASSNVLSVNGIGAPVTTRWWQSSGPVKRYFPKEYHDTFNSIRAALPSLQAQGVQALELAPITAGPPAPFAGLGATDNYAVDPTLGTMADFSALLRAAHSRGMHIIIFGNLGYASVEAPFFKQAVADFAAGKDTDVSKWFVLSHKNEGGGWYQYPGTDVYYFAYWGQPSPTYNWSLQPWRDEASKILRFWMDKGIDGIGLDAPLAYYGFSEDLNNAYVTDVLRTYDRSMMPEGIGTDYTGAEQRQYQRMVTDFGYSTIQDLSINFWGDASRNKIVPAMIAQDPSGLDAAFTASRDAVTAVGGVQIEAPGWEADLTGSTPDPAKIVPAKERILEFATLTGGGGLTYLSNGTDAYRPEVQTIANWTAGQKESLYRVLRAQTADKALEPAGSRAAVPTNNDQKYLAFLRTDRTGALKALVIMNYQKTAQKITVHLDNTGLASPQTPIDLLTGASAAPITGADYSVQLPGYGFTELAVR
ncbi:MAG TPA: discoidin domain-containing protein [Mycobacteriales bacterium]|nr:discoidin domain-containing protein [Mycobacteriales bacterium]